MFRTRLISGIILVAVMLALIIPGGIVLLIGSLVISLIGLMEFYRVLGVNKKAAGIAGYTAAVLYYVTLFFVPMQPEWFILALAVGLLIAVLAFYVFTYPAYHAQQILGLFFGFFYVPLLLSYIYRTRELVFFSKSTGAYVEIGAYLVWLIFLSSWGSDTCAYCVGMLFGKHKMAPVLSPKKTWEGAAGGVAGAAVLTLIYSLVFQRTMGLSTPQIIGLTLVGAAGAVVSMIGDLAASAIKRNYDIKDYGKLIPGHGGILDRFDSVIFTAPAVYYLAVILLQEMA